MDMTVPDRASELQLQEEFNRWAEEGRGEGMEEHHLPIVEPTLALMNLQPADCVLDVGCGSGWLVRRLAASVPGGQAVGIDVSDEMIRRAQLACAGIPNARFLHGTAEEIPAQADSFTKVLSVESAYYWPDPARGIREIFRVLRPGGSAWILINYYRDNPYCHQWGALYSIPTHLLSAAEWQERFGAAGFREVSHRRIPDGSPSPEVYTGRWFRDAEEMRRFKAEGALLVTSTKPTRP
jgi:ubiquinone/menaquinone biosynthesis C-methylase UbiE